jgi:excisionase family DNA binding protein
MPQQLSGDRVLLSTTEATEKSGLSRVHIQRLLRNGQLDGVKLGHDWLVFEDSLLAYITQPHKTGPKGPRKKATSNAPTTSITCETEGSDNSTAE